MPNSLQTIVLVHGAFRGGWCWREVRRILQADGYEVFTPDLTGAGTKAHLNNTEITLQTWLMDVVKLLEYEDLHDVLLVGHSMGGVVITAASEHAAPRIARLVYLDAPAPEHGETAADMLPADFPKHLANVPRTGLIAPRPVPASDDLTPEKAAWVNKRLTPVAAAPTFEPLILQNPQALALPRSYLFGRDTPPFFPAATTRQRCEQSGTPYQIMPTGHDCMLTHPALVADYLRELLPNT